MHKEKRLTEQQVCYATIDTMLRNFAERMLGSSRKEKRKFCPRNGDEGGWGKIKRKK